MKTFKYKVSVQGENIKESNTWKKIIVQAKKLAKNNLGQIVTVRTNDNNHISESFVWDVSQNDIVPAYYNV